MSSLKNVVHPTRLPVQINRPTPSLPSPAKKQKMSLTQTYMLAHIARGKLSKEASKPDHDLRRLVGHANLLDGLMLDLSNAEQEQESWFNSTVSNATKPEEPKRVQWADTIPEEVLDEEDEDSDSDSDDEEFETAQEMPIRRVSKTPSPVEVEMQDDDDEEMEDDDDYEDSLALTRTSSAHPPELMQEDSEDSESDDDSMPPSPPAASLNFNALSEKQRQAIATTSLYQPDEPISQSEEESFFDQGVQTAIAAY